MRVMIHDILQAGFTLNETEHKCGHTTQLLSLQDLGPKAVEIYNWYILCGIERGRRHTPSRTNRVEFFSN